MFDRARDLFAYVLLLAALALAFCNGCAAVPPPAAPKWSDRVPVTAAVYVFVAEGRCSGVAVDDHHVWTAAHCVAVPGPITVITFPGVERRATVQYVDPINDRAVLRVEGSRLPVQARIATTLPEEGELLFLAAFGCYQSLAVAPGLFVAVSERWPGSLVVAMGTCQGDSGGPVFNSRGEVVGLMSRKADTLPLAIITDVIGGF